MIKQTKSRFTLIEILICIAVILILIALLMPALSRTRYTAKLVVCASILNQVALSAFTYASNNDTRYPHRVAAFENHGYGTPFAIKDRSWRDDRETISELSIRDVQCPFVEPVDWEANDTFIHLNYNLFFGWRVRPTVSKLKVTDQIEWNGDSFDILASDKLMYSDVGYYYSSHPDYGTGDLVYTKKFDRWNNWFTRVRRHDPLDLNYCRDDGSVFRLQRLHTDDSRLKWLPYKWNGSRSRGEIMCPPIGVDE